MSDINKAKQTAHDIVTEATSRTEKIRAMAKELGVPEKQVESHINQLAYRIEYNQRPEVKATRREYNRKRAAEMKVFRQLLKDDPRVAELVKG